MRSEIEIHVEERFGIDRVLEPVRIGVPFPKGMLCSGDRLRLKSEHGPALLQSRVLGRWSDGSAQWVLIEFLATVPAGRSVGYRLEVFSDAATAMVADSRLSVVEQAGRIVVDTGKGSFRIDKGTCPFSNSGSGDDVFASMIGSSITLTNTHGEPLRAEVEKLATRERGPIRAGVTGQGRFRKRKDTFARFRIAYHFFSGLPVFAMEFEVHNPRAARHPGGYWDLGDAGSIFFRDLSISISGLRKEGLLKWTTDPTGQYNAESGSRWILYQDSSGGENWNCHNHFDRHGRSTTSFRGYRVLRGESAKQEVIQTGDRALPTVSAQTRHGWISVAVQDFWQNFPKSLEFSGSELRIGLFPGKSTAGFELQGGERKRHTVFFEFGGETSRPGAITYLQLPLSVGLDPEWVERSGALPYFVSEKKDSNTRYASYVKRAIEGSDSFFSKREKIDEYGWRNYGDLYADHENTGHEGGRPLVSHYNNQYDFLYGAFVHYLRSIDPRWWELMVSSAKHVMDIDIYHTDEDKSAYNHGLFWHTDHHRDAGGSTHRTYSKSQMGPGGGPSNEHNYTTGLLSYYFFTGNPEAWEAVLELAGWVLAMDDGAKNLLGLFDDGPTGLATRTASADYHKPGRGAGNSINALLDAYWMTRERAYLESGEKLIRRCIHPADDIGRLRLNDPERKWSYLVFLQVLGKYLDMKTEMSEADYSFFYARESLLHYARWMSGNEVPYKDVLHKVEFPTETWPAHDVRKSCIFNFAAKYAPPEESPLFARKARHFFERSLGDLLTFETAATTRPMVIQIVNGPMQGYFDMHGTVLVPYVNHAHEFGRPADFIPQKSRLRKTILSKLKTAESDLKRIVLEAAMRFARSLKLG